MSEQLPRALGERFSALKSRLQDLCNGAEVHYLPNHGNWGDGLIRWGTLKLLADAGIDYREHHHVRWRKPKILRKPAWLRSIKNRDGILLYGGGGAWCSYWDRSAYLTELSAFFRHVIVLPSTFEVRPRLPSATLFCRDTVESQRRVPEAEFCDDLAFYLGRQRSQPGSGSGFFFRTDRESSGQIALPPDNRDLSLEAKYLEPYEGFFAVLAELETVHTDRLHVAIASSLLGKNVHLYEGGYFKNRAVYAASIAGNFPNVMFHNSPPDFSAT